MRMHPWPGLRPAHQNITPVHVATPGHTGTKARQVDAMARPQGIEYIVWQGALGREFEVTFQNGRDIHKHGGK